MLLSQIRSGKIVLNDAKLKILILADAASFHTERYIEELNRQNCITRLLSLEKGLIPFTTLTKKSPIKSLHYYFSVKQIKIEIKNNSKTIDWSN